MKSTPSVRDVDARIAELGATLDRMRQNLVELDADVTRRTLATSTALRGRTAEAWAAADGSMDDLWRSLLALDAVSADLADRRGTRSSVPRPVLAELAGILDGPSVALPASPDGTPGAAPRSLTAGPEAVVRRPVDDVVAEMSDAYRLVAVVDGVYRVWSTVSPGLDGLAGELVRIGDATVTRSDRLDLARALVGEYRSLAASDPLGLPDDALRSAGAAVDAARAELATVVARSTELDGLLTDIGDGLAAVRAAVDAGGAPAGPPARIATRAEGTDPARLRAEVGELETDLLAVRMMARTRPADAHRRAETLAARVDVLVADAQGLDRLEAEGLAERDELRGRLDALQAKAGALGRAEDPELDRIRREASDELYGAPCDLDRSSALVDEYQRTLRTMEGVGR